mgnify:FL=1
MKKLTWILTLTLCLALLLTACGSQPTPAPEPTPDPDPITTQPDPVTEPDPATEPDNTPIDPDVKKYFEYFQNPYNNADIFLLYPNAGQKETAGSRAAYVLVKLAAEEMAAGKEVTYSYPKAEYDRAAMEYLGEPITQYETRKTTLTQDGNVESTGWCGNIPDFMVLTHLEQLGENHYKGVFSVYGNGYGQGDDPAEAYEDCCNRLMHGNILPTDFLLGTRTLEWKEWESPLLGLQLRYLSCEFTPAN